MRLEHDRHVDQPTLVLVADGEADATQAAAVQSHLANCRDCRSRLATLQALNEFVLTCRQALNRQVRPAEEPRARLRVLLSSGVEEKDARSFGNRFSDIFLPGIRLRYLMSATAVATLAAFVWFAAFTPVVSAKEFLVRATAAQTTHGPVNRAWRIRLQGKDFSRQSEELQRRGRSIFVGARLDWDEPLSSTAFARWHDQASDRSDKVTRSGGHLTLRTTTKTDPVQEASYTVEAQTWLPVSETIALRDGRNVEITVIPNLPDSDGDAAIAGRLVTPETNSVPEAQTAPSEPASSPPNGLSVDDSEVLARVALYKLGSVDGSQIDFHRLDDGTLSVRTLVESEARKQSVLGALAPIPNVRTDIRTFAEVADRSAVGPGPHSAPDTAVVATAIPAFQHELEINFPDAGDRVAFVNSVLAESQRASAEAWETGVLVRRYTEKDVDRLQPETRDALERLIREHVDALSGAVRAIALRITPLILLPQPGAAPVSSAKSWRKALLLLTQQTLALHQEIQEGLSASRSRNSEELRIGIISDLQDLENRLQGSGRGTSGHFLKDEENNATK